MPDPADLDIAHYGGTVQLSWSERVVFSELARRRGRLVKRETLTTAIYNARPHAYRDALPAYDSLAANITHLRQKLPKAVIRCVWGQGFVLDPVGQ